MKGVYYDKKSKKFRSQISIGNQKIRLGDFNSIQEAEQIRIKAQNFKLQNNSLLLSSIFPELTEPELKQLLKDYIQYSEQQNGKKQNGKKQNFLTFAIFTLKKRYSNYTSNDIKNTVKNQPENQPQILIKNDLLLMWLNGFSLLYIARMKNEQNIPKLKNFISIGIENYIN